MRALAPLFVALLASGSGTALALSGAESDAVRAVVVSQFEAFADDDAERAFSLTTRALRQRFGGAQQFITNIRNEYSMIYRPTTVEYYDIDEIADKVYLPVQVSDVRGEYWLAMYEVQRQRDGTWLINGSVVSRSRNPIK